MNITSDLLWRAFTCEVGSDPRFIRGCPESLVLRLAAQFARSREALVALAGCTVRP